jgi:hypothetical protein
MTGGTTTAPSVSPLRPTTSTERYSHSAKRVQARHYSPAPAGTRAGRYGSTGTTIIEVVMALTILGIALPPLIASFADASRQTILPAQATVASFLATERMEQIVARRYRGIYGGQRAYTAVSVAEFPDEVPVTGFTSYERRVTVTEIDHLLNPVGSPAGYRKVRVTVSWNGGVDHLFIERVFADF